MSYLSSDLKLLDSPPLYRSVIGFPLFKSEGTSVIYIGYDKAPATPLDSSIFGEHETNLLRKVSDIVAPLFSKADAKTKQPESFTFDDLLRYNQKLMIERIGEEIERAERYHHGFTVTVFKVSGLQAIISADYQAGLRLVNELSVGVRAQVRKTDFFSWTEPDLFIVLSVEGYQRMGYLENRIKELVAKKLQEKGYYETTGYYPSNGYAVFPGSSATAAELINEAKSRIPA
jgi:GGDEF domain-containing protein